VGLFETILRRRRMLLLGAGPVLVIAVAAGLVFTLNRPANSGQWQQPAPRVAASALPSVPPVEPTITPRPAPASLPDLDYEPPPAGFPDDSTPLSTVRLTEGLHAASRVGAYDRPGGRPLAFLPPDIRGVQLTVPIVERRSGWVAVMLPSANRKVAWIPPGGPVTTVPLRDQIIVERQTHTLTWFRDGVRHRSWPVTLGVPATPTPLGRTFIIGRSKLKGAVYAGTDVFALGSVPDNPDAIPAGLRGAHIGIHTWHNDRSLGKNTSDGCIRLTKSGQQLLLAEVAPGTEVVVVDKLA
jgi:lipoprotein-anchoring transpeptidase ErfK/SrfK